MVMEASKSREAELAKKYFADSSPEAGNDVVHCAVFFQLDIRCPENGDGELLKPDPAELPEGFEMVPGASQWARPTENGGDAH